MDRAKEAIHRYCEDKGEEGFTKRIGIWNVIEERWNNTLHRLIHATGLYLNSTYSYASGFRFDVEVMYGFFQCVQRMVLSPVERLEISKQIQIYKLSVGIFGYEMAIQDRTTTMSSKLQFVSNFQISMSFLPIY
jgi:hypothetical protein